MGLSKNWSSVPSEGNDFHKSPPEADGRMSTASLPTTKWKWLLRRRGEKLGNTTIIAGPGSQKTYCVVSQQAKRSRDSGSV